MPTLKTGGELFFWGVDAMGFAKVYLEDPLLLATDAMRRVDELLVGAGVQRACRRRAGLGIRQSSGTGGDARRATAPFGGGALELAVVDNGKLGRAPHSTSAISWPGGSPPAASALSAAATKSAGPTT